MKQICVINVVGLTPRLIGEHTPCLARLSASHAMAPLQGVLPAVTCSAQASLLTGTMPSEHGIVGNGWLFRDTCEIRFWQQARTLIQGETVYEAAAKQDPSFTCAKLFWWFNQGATVDWSLTPKPWYGCDGNKAFGVHGKPDGLVEEVEDKLGPFPFHTFWGPAAGPACSQWIAASAAHVVTSRKPNLTLVYLPHLDYDLQRFGLAQGPLQQALQDVDACVATVVKAAEQVGCDVVVVSEYGLATVKRPVHLNRILREHNLLAVRSGPFGEVLDVPECSAVSVADHQLSHVYIKDKRTTGTVRALLQGVDGVQEVWGTEEKRQHGLDHPRSGDLVVLAERDAWFTYYFWLDDRSAPDYAPTIDIHHKPGYDPCELFWDPSKPLCKLRGGLRLLQKKLGFRTRFDVVPLDAGLVLGSHGLNPASSEDGPVCISTLPNRSLPAHMCDFKAYLLDALLG